MRIDRRSLVVAAALGIICAIVVWVRRPPVPATPQAIALDLAVPSHTPLPTRAKPVTTARVEETHVEAPRPGFGFLDFEPVGCTTCEGHVAIDFVRLEPLGLGADDVDTAPFDECRANAERVEGDLVNGRARFELPGGAWVIGYDVRPLVTSGDLRKTFLPRRDRYRGPVVQPGETVELGPLVFAGFLVHGVVVDASDQTPLAGVSIWRPLPRVMCPDEVTTDAKGEFTCAIAAEDLDHGRVEMTAEDPDHVRAEIEIRNDAFAYVVEGVKFELRKGVVVRGRVVDERGAGVSARLRAAQFTDEPPSWGRALAFDELAFAAQDGRFRFPAIPASEDVVVTAESDGHAPVRIEGLDCRRDVDDLVVSVGAGVVLEIASEFPDGGVAWMNCVSVVLRDDAGRTWRPASPGPDESWRFGVAPRRRYAISCWARSPEDDDRAAMFHGAGTIEWDGELLLGSRWGDRVLRTTLRLAPAVPAMPPPPLADEPCATLHYTRPAVGFTWIVAIRDDGTGEPITERTVSFATDADDPIALHPSESGTVRLTLQPGTSHARVGAPSYEPKRLEIDSGEAGFASATLSLRRRD
jgi:hypothetical protein